MKAIFTRKSLFDENRLAMEIHNLPEPPYLYGKNLNVFKENGETYKGTIWLAPKHKAREGTL